MLKFERDSCVKTHKYLKEMGTMKRGKTFLLAYEN